MKTLKDQKFFYGDVVEVDTLIDKLMVTDSWWQDQTYGSKNGDYVYRLRFMTKSGGVDKRKNPRQFEESRLTKANA